MTWRLAILALGAAAWLAGFAVLPPLASWTSFALAGPALTGLALFFDADARALLRPSVLTVGLGLGVGLLMAALTHVAFAAVTSLVPQALTTTERLFDLLHVGNYTPAARGGLIVVVATCEEVIFRGAVAGASGARDDPPLHRPGQDDLLRVVALAAVYALAMATLGSSLLVMCAFGCAIVWGLLRVATRSLVAPIVAHVVWDLFVLVVWPLVSPGFAIGYTA
jgi:membrane protease YdiL (CAAX protease family)